MTLDEVTNKAMRALAPMFLRLADFMNNQAAQIRQGHTEAVAATLDRQAQLIRQDWRLK